MKNLPITYLKALGIILMVTAHAHAPKTICDAICLFHMPLFFIASGYCFKLAYLSTPFKFVKRRLQSVWWPYVKWMAIFTLLHNAFFKLNLISDEYGVTGTDNNHIYMTEELFHRLGEVFIFLSHEDLLSGYWFLKSLFWGSMIFCFLLWCFAKIVKNQHYSALTVGIILVVANIFLQYLHREWTVFHISPRDFHAAFFIWFGFFWHQKNIESIKDHWAIFMCLSSLILGLLFWRESMLSMSLTKWIPYTISACVCTISILIIIKHIPRVLSSHIEFIGNNTLTILTWHFLSFKVVSYALVSLYHLPAKQLAEWPIIHSFEDSFTWVLYLFSGIAIPMTLAYINKFIPNKYCKF